ncbi:hypothetical protein [Nakamurella lactea]|uniref:hypothetical protein n=1 Tax=Nakamurella lactea TaxID=459515 RepID=UPI00041489B8|nr:hypothetical protein [Nakamurella lactea]
MAQWPLKTLDGVMTLNTDAKTIRCAGQGGSLEGAVATVDSAGNLDKRITASRILLTGVFALAWQKKKDNRELYILVDAPEYSMAMRVDPKLSNDARKFAAGINTIAKGGTVNGANLGTAAATKAITDDKARRRKERKAAGKNPLLPSDWAYIVVFTAIAIAIIIGIVS